MPYLHRVTCKAALFNPTYTKVVLVEYEEHDLGLTGGHLEKDETPDDAVRRELREELNIGDEVHLKRKDFWVHTNGKIILGYVGILSENTRFAIDPEEIRAAHWVSINDLRDGKISAGPYDDFILQNSSAG